MIRVLAFLVAMLMSAANASAEIQPYAVVYEPETSFVLASTVAWKADSVEFAQEEVRPGTALVCLDKDLTVYSEDGALICESLDDYIAATAQRVIPALYIRDEDTAAALKEYLQDSGLADVFVAADYRNAELVREVASLLYVRGLVDFRSMNEGDCTLTDLIKITNGNAAKVALLPERLATEDNVRFLQERLITVWAECESSAKSLLTQYTNGVNGVLVDDYQMAVDALGFFDDDAPSLLRVPGIIGHRGMPSMFVENTVMSAQGAFAAGADAIESDIYLSADGEIFVVHDGGMERLFNRADIQDVEKLALEELQAIPFDNDAPSGVQEKNNTPGSKAVNGQVCWLPSQRIPTQRELYEIFLNSGAMMDTEIKSKNPEIVGELRNLVEEMGNFDEVFVITFNTVILDEMAKRWPEMSVGALGSQSQKPNKGQPHYQDYEKIIKKAGVEKALEMLYGQIDQWNATFNPNRSFSYDLAVAGRHRGLTVWPWTYNEPEQFAEAYLQGLYGLTTNFAWWATDFVRDIRANDAVIEVGGTLPPAVVTAQSGQRVGTDGLELVAVEGSLEEAGETLCIYRLKQSLTIDGRSYGDYYLYSNPFTVTVE